MWLLTVLLLVISNVFMTLAWYGHLKFKTSALWMAIVVSWMIALVEYCFQVPANRIGHNAGIAAAQLKTIQEVITLVVFCLFSVWYLKEPMRWTYVVGFVLIASGALFVFAPWQEPAKHAPRPAPVQQVEPPAVVATVPAKPAEAGHETTDVATAG
ncbi:MAG TPA: DMT family protein [Thermoguttaceae bacterium]|nr:DMT family protein [Thermoguttaceae bacterium]